MAETPKTERAKIWRETLLGIASEKGFFEDVGAMHKAIFIPAEGDKGKTLVVVFDNLDDARQDPERLPWAVDFISAQGWSSLGFMAHGPTWYRDEAVFDFFDRMTAEGFFERFERVVFFGTSMGGYAACAFSAAVPGATVVAINPQSTLSRDYASWERRFRPAWRQDYSSRYGFAPDMVKTAEKVWLFYDSSIRGDAAHVALFQGDNITKIRCPFMGHGMLTVWRDMGVLKPIVSSCINGEATRQSVTLLLRERHKSLAYKRLVSTHLEKTGQHRRVIRWADAVMRNRRGPFFVKARERALEKLGGQK